MSAKRGATYEVQLRFVENPPASRTTRDLLAVPDHKVAEIVSGELFASPRPRIRHARVGAALTGALYDSFDRGDLESDILVPDIAGWRRDTLSALPDDPAFTIAPEWVCEILSPSTFELDRERKTPAYSRHGVRWLWLVDPGERTLEVYRREGNRWARIESHRADDFVHAEPFEAAQIELSLLWP